ncbi:NAD(P) transhydrogenase subunit alpha [Flammeovirga yaeyamensis]|uniref:NAD(P) transhydrogenase subunit alpha part 1 n=1 Tax=Flammeovirga yaeyamensis TaxID=367791 RepID=A0AAX1N3E0_9BACT|nr:MULTISPECIES: NAD(P) transhydrogenase subunit alpha [Flammeovirga]ANQ50864.1 NAD(P) transhydrogenase subunit alpha [Flammeovirga sp. MY04]MBB3700731.1 NAD(P) transhydrogenase subunit alpha [Flammeovirga yaeyamensis]NMF37912.1 NAD(P) transhydrogenase subunit alpha [Flammeovirga yaeyamensis]QWG01727.1 NAD(P) transhydrogenase subunit alpha [Flammeovirga yaeyamensis]
MLFGILRENDLRVAITPDLANKFISEGHKVCFEKGAGESAYFDDSVYTSIGAEEKSREEILKSANVLITISPLEEGDVDLLQEGTFLFSSYQPFQDASICERYAKKGISAFSFDMIPRTTIAQSMDILSSMASISGYKAVLKATDYLPRYMPMLSTAAGTVPPSKVLIMGAGVAGLQAIATAKRLGAQVEAFDTRAAAKEEVQSLGAKFVEVEGATDDTNAGGYAVEQTEEYKKRQAELIAQKIEKADVVITTAQLRGRPAPTLVTEEAVKTMKPGSVIVDLASSTGGNCALTEDEKVVKKHGVTIIGNSNLAADISEQASVLYSKNIQNYLKLMLTAEGLNFDFSDEIILQSCIVYNGEVVYGNEEKQKALVPAPQVEEAAEQAEA